MSFAAKKLIILETVDSTNNYAMGMIQNGSAKSGYAVFAKKQTAGRGRRGKTWKSAASKNIMLSIIAEMQWLPIRQQFQLSMGVALGCLDFFSNYLKENIKIKWPNDIFVNDRKAGGVLIENIIKGNLWQWAVIGIGININQENFEQEKFCAISLKEITGKDYDVIELSEKLHLCILKRIEGLSYSKTTDLLHEYNENLFCRNELVKLKKGNIIFETIIKEVSASGELITSDVIERSFELDEIQWVGKP